MKAKQLTLLFAFRRQSLKKIIGDIRMKISLRYMIIPIVAIVVIAFACTFLTTPVEARADQGIQNYVRIEVYDMYGEYCRTIKYNYLTPDTTTQHYQFYHRGPRVPDTHDNTHLTIVTEVRNWPGRRDLDTLCDGTMPIFAYYSS